MKSATLKQAEKILSIFDDTPAEQIQAIIESGLLADLRDANVSEIKRDEARRLFGLKPLEQAAPASQSAYPAVGEIFELTLNGDDSANNPIEMIRRDGYNPKGWQFIGQQVAGKQTRRFKLVSVGYCRNLDEVQEKLASHGSIPEGQWREVFKVAYPKSDSKGPVGVADSSWVSPTGHAFFPFAHAGGYSCFGWAGIGFGEHWRWLVEVSK